MTDYIFIPTPISEKPKEDFKGQLFIIDYDGFQRSIDWESCNRKFPEAATFWLRKVPRQGYDREVREGFAEWVAKQGWLYNKEKELWVRSRLVYNSFNKFEDQFAPTADLLQTYLETL